MAFYFSIWEIVCPQKFCIKIQMTVALVFAKWLQYYPIICEPMECIAPDSFVHGVLQARILKWVAIQGIFPTQGLNLHLLHLLHWRQIQPGKPPVALTHMSILVALCLCLTETKKCKDGVWDIKQKYIWVTQPFLKRTKIELFGFHSETPRERKIWN